MSPGVRSLFPGLWCLAPPLLLMGVIFWLGTDRASGAQTQVLLARLLSEWAPALYQRLGAEGLIAMNVVLRKCGHFLGYALLAALNARAVRRLAGPGRPGKAAVIGAGAALLWAAVDELHQSFSPGRGAAGTDVALDGAGAACGVLLYHLCTRRARPQS